jgi:hypothetical protein
VGGTGLYFRALTEGLAEIPPIPDDDPRRGRGLPPRTCSTWLQAHDPRTVARIDTRNPARVRRAWEVLRGTGRRWSRGRRRRGAPLLPLRRPTAIVLDADRDWLNDRIARRFDQMLDAGALEEARGNLHRWDRAGGARKAIGAPELIAHLRGEMSLDAAREAAIIASRQYAKRQRTWFRARMQATGHRSRCPEGAFRRKPDRRKRPRRFPLAIPRPVASLAPMFETTRRPLAHSVSSLGKLRMQGAWKVELLHSAPRHRLYWITRGQGRISVNCITRGYGPNTAVFVPARAPMALELPSQTQGLELCLPPDDSLGLPDEPFHLRVSSLEAQGSLTSHLEKIERELAAQAPAMERALAAYSLLVSVWMTRELAGRKGAILRERSHRLVELFAERMEAQFRTGRGIARLRQAASGHAHPSQPRLPGGRGSPGPCAPDRTHHVRGAAAASGYRHARPRDRRASGLFLGGLFHARLHSGNGPDTVGFPRPRTPRVNPRRRDNKAKKTGCGSAQCRFCS